MIEIEERWRTIPGFSNYEISDKGKVFNISTSQVMSTSQTKEGHVKISLMSDDRLSRHTVTVAPLVAEAFVEPYNVFCDHVVVLDGDLSNITAENLVWRPRWFVWKYTHQLKVQQPLHYENLPVLNVDTEEEYDSIIQCGVTEGLLFVDIWRSTFSKSKVFPYGFIYEILERV